MSGAVAMYHASPKRYEQMIYARSGRSGLLLPRLTLGLWQNFGGPALRDEVREMILKAFDRGVTHFDLANNYGPPPGSA
jgi:L-glyceraldehyde 3-phosphate reductase